MDLGDEAVNYKILSNHVTLSTSLIGFSVKERISAGTRLVRRASSLHHAKLEKPWGRGWVSICELNFWKKRKFLIYCQDRSVYLAVSQNVGTQSIGVQQSLCSD